MSNPTAKEPRVSEKPKCELCGEPMPAGEEMFKFHGYSGPCPKPPLPAPPKADSRDAEIERLRAEVYHTAPGELEFGGEGWTWKQQARANEDRLRELEAEVARLGGVVAAAVQAEQAARERMEGLIAERDELRNAAKEVLETHANRDGSALEALVRLERAVYQPTSRAVINPAPPAKEPTNG